MPKRWWGSSSGDGTPVLAVFLFMCVLTVAAYFAYQRVKRDSIAGHAAADAIEFQWGLQNGINDYLHVSRELAGYVAASPTLTLKGLRSYLDSMSGIRHKAGTNYVGFVPRVARSEAGAFERAARSENSGYSAKVSGPDPHYIYPYLFVFPRDQRASAAQGLDFSSVPERWEAMQRARDTGQSVATRMHSYRTGPPTSPLIALFTPVYDLSRPAATVGQRRAALRGFVFSFHQVDAMVEELMGSQFGHNFDLEIFDGPVSRANMIYAGGEQALSLGKDDTGIYQRELLNVGGREWQMFFFPKQQYFDRFDGWEATSILVAGFLLSAASAALTRVWVRKHRARLLTQHQAVRFDSVFDTHPSAVYMLDRQRHFINANAQALRELGISREELAGKSVVDFIAPDKRALAAERFESALQGESVAYDSASLDSKGRRVESAVILVPIKMHDQVSYVLAFAQNVTARKQREWELTESKMMLRRVVNNIPQRVFWKDLDLNFLGANEALCRDAGLDSPDKLIGKSDFDFAWRGNAEKYRADDRIILSSGQARINYEERQVRGDGVVNWLRTSKIPLTDMNGKIVALLGMYEDITAQKEMEAKLRQMAHYDGLTGLANRSFFYQHLEQELAKARRYGRLLALMYFDVDFFKQVNDSYGHDVGDALLVEFGRRIKSSLREADLAARLGGDEFAVLLYDLPDRAAGVSVAGKLVHAMRAPVVAGARTLRISTSIGIAYSGHDTGADQLIQRADQAMYRAKQNGRDRYEVDPGPAA